MCGTGFPTEDVFDMVVIIQSQMLNSNPHSDPHDCDTPCLLCVSHRSSVLSIFNGECSERERPVDFQWRVLPRVALQQELFPLLLPIANQSPAELQISERLLNRTLIEQGKHDMNRENLESCHRYVTLLKILYHSTKNIVPSYKKCCENNLQVSRPIVTMFSVHCTKG